MTVLSNFQQHNLCMPQRMVLATQFNSSWSMVPTGQSWKQLIARFREYTAAWIRVARQQNWINQAVIGWTLEKQYHNVWVKTWDFRVSVVSPGSAEALVRWGGKIEYRLTAYILSNIPAKSYQNRLMYVKVIASQSSVVFWDSVQEESIGTEEQQLHFKISHWTDK